MSNPSLRDYLNDLAAKHPGDILRIKEETSCDFFTTSLAFELERRNQPSLIYCERVVGYNIPLVTNVFASKERIDRMLTAYVPDPAAIWVELERYTKKPRLVPTGPVKDNILIGDKIDFKRFPIPQHFERDGGKYLTSAVVVANDPDTGIRNLSYHRIQMREGNRLGISLGSRGHLWDYYQRAEAKNKPLEIAAFVGAHPLLLLGAVSKVGIDVDEYDICGALLGEPVELVKCETVDVDVPAQAEIVIEGYIPPHEREPEGPLAEYPGYVGYNSTHNIFVVTAITHRNNPIFFDLVPGNSSDHLRMARAAKELFVFRRLKEIVDTVQALHYPNSGVSFHAFISLKKSLYGKARLAMIHLFALDHNVKLVIAVDDDVDVTDTEEVMWAVATRMQADRDIFVVPRVFCNWADPSCVEGTSAKMGIDATTPPGWKAERAVVSPEKRREAAKFLESLGLFPALRVR